MRYVHLRVHEINSSETATDMTKPDVKGGATIAYDVVNLGEGEPIPSVIYHIAKCNHKDNFCKKLGRMIAGGRLKAGKFRAFPITKDTKNKDIVSHLIQCYYEEEEEFWTDVKHFVY